MSSCWAHSSFSTSMIKDKGQILQCQTFNSKQPPKSSEKGTLIHFFFLSFFFSCRKYFFLSLFFFFSCRRYFLFFSLFFSAFICNGQVYPSPTLIFDNFLFFFCFFNHHISKHNHSSTKSQNKGRDKTILKFRVGYCG